MAAPSLTLRPYDHGADLDPCMRIWRDASQRAHAFLGEDAFAADALLVRERYMPHADITVAERAGHVVGFIALLDAHIGGLFVAPAAHRQGVGAALVAHAFAARGPLTVEVYRDNAAARRFYEALGFTLTGERPTDDLGRPHPLLALTLGTPPTAPGR